MEKFNSSQRVLTALFLLRYVNSSMMTQKNMSDKEQMISLNNMQLKV